MSLSPPHCALTRLSDSFTTIGPVGAPTALKQLPTLLTEMVDSPPAVHRVFGDTQFPTTV
jgi:hypothetical protein